MANGKKTKIKKNGKTIIVTKGNINEGSGYFEETGKKISWKKKKKENKMKKGGFFESPIPTLFED